MLLLLIKKCPNPSVPDAVKLPRVDKKLTQDLKTCKSTLFLALFWASFVTTNTRFSKDDSRT